jgi:plastocyanin
MEASTSRHAFDRGCLAAPADTAFTIRLDNRDSDMHNVNILDHPGGTSLFLGELVKGPKVVTYDVDPLAAGTYYFRCDVHPLQMNGDFLVVAG